MFLMTIEDGVAMNIEETLADFENNFVMTIDSLASKNDSEHDAINRQLAELGGGGIVANENKINPAYYKGTAMADYVSKFQLNFDLGSVIKYVSRAGKKQGELALEDLRKAQWYLAHAIEQFGNEVARSLKPSFED